VSNLAKRLYARLKELKYPINTISDRLCFYVEGMNTDGTLNADRFNEWNDVCFVIDVVRDVPKIILRAVATTEPGRYYTQNRMNPKGAARIELDTPFPNAWIFGVHREGTKGAHEALVQCGIISVRRDANEDGMRTGDKLDVGDYFFINQHGTKGYDPFEKDIGRASAGCLVILHDVKQQEYIRLVVEFFGKKKKVSSIVLDGTKVK
jgi:hypothetical protein